jgi:hypothetical protein
VQKNVAELREFRSGLADLERARGEMRERRVMLRANPAPDQTAAEAAAGQLLALTPGTAGLYRVWANPTVPQVGQWVEQKLFASGATAGPESKLAPSAGTDTTAGTEQDLEVRIDEPPLTDDRAAAAFLALGRQIGAMRLQAILEVENTRVDTDQVFVRPQAALVLLADRAWDATAIRTALTTAANGLWTSSGLGAGWRAGANGVQELDGLGALVMAVDGKRLILGNSSELVGEVLARRAQPAVAGAVYAAGWRHARELPNFERMTRMIDFPQIHVDTAGAGAAPTDVGQGREPMFYSENAASLGRALVRVDNATITVHDLGSMLREAVVYGLNP